MGGKARGETPQGVSPRRLTGRPWKAKVYRDCELPVKRKVSKLSVGRSLFQLHENGRKKTQCLVTILLRDTALITYVWSG